MQQKGNMKSYQQQRKDASKRKVGLCQMLMNKKKSRSKTSLAEKSSFIQNGYQSRATTPPHRQGQCLCIDV